MPIQQLFIGADLDWVREVHCPNAPKQARSVLFEGNEDYPTRLVFYAHNDPYHDDPPIATFTRDRNGDLLDVREALFQRAQQASEHYKTAHKKPGSLWASFWYGAKCAHWGPHTIEGSAPPGPDDYHYRAAMLGYAFGLRSLWKGKG